MLIFFVTLSIFVIAVAAMAIGVLVTGRRLSGSCGGTNGAACVCSAERRARCKSNPEGTDHLRAHAATPIDPAQLSRAQRSQ